MRVDSEGTGNDGERPHEGGSPQVSQPDTELAEWERPGAWRLRTGLILSLVGAISLAGLTGGAWALRDESSNCSGKPEVLRVTASPDIAPALRRVAARFNVQTHDVRGRCVRVQVAERESVATSRALSGQGVVGVRADVDAWVPDSSIWVNVARASNAGAKLVSPRTTTLALSPLVLATPRPVAQELRKKKVRPSWRLTFPAAAKLFGGPSSGAKVNVQILDPATSSSGIATVIAARRLIGDRKQSATVLTSYVRGLQRNASNDTAALFGYFAGLGAKGRPVVVSSEQSMISYNEANRPNPASALVPDEGTFLLDYPFVVTTNDPVRKEAAEAFRWQLKSRLGQEEIHRLGFRSVSGRILPSVAHRHGISQQPPRRLVPPTPGQVGEALQAWNRLGLGSRMLVLADVSGSMREQVPGIDKTRIEVAAAAAQTGLRLFPDDTDIGLWEFSTFLDGRKDYRERVPIGPITEEVRGEADRRKLVGRAAAGLRPKEDGDTGLYDSIFAAYKEVKQGWRPDKFNSVLVLTDGANDDPEGGLSLVQLQDKLREEADPQRPIQVIVVAFGPETDPESMKKVARLTGGAAYTTKDPAQIVNVFLEAIGRRLCNPDCGAQN